MKKVFFTSLAALVLSTTMISLSSCKGDPSEHDLFIGKYEGTVGYGEVTNFESLTVDKGTTTVSKIGKTYNFSFTTENGKKVPPIKDIKFQSSDSKSTAAIGLEGGRVISINDGKLHLRYSEGIKKFWAADGTRK